MCSRCECFTLCIVYVLLTEPDRSPYPHATEVVVADVTAQDPHHHTVATHQAPHESVDTPHLGVETTLLAENTATALHDGSHILLPTNVHPAGTHVTGTRPRAAEDPHLQWTIRIDAHIPMIVTQRVASRKTFPHHRMLTVAVAGAHHQQTIWVQPEEVVCPRGGEEEDGAHPGIIAAEAAVITGTMTTLTIVVVVSCFSLCNLLSTFSFLFFLLANGLGLLLVSCGGRFRASNGTGQPSSGSKHAGSRGAGKRDW